MSEFDGERPEFMPWDGRRVPVTLLGGYLGSGKTTAINALLARTSRPTAILVNDAGPVNIDASLVKRRHGDTIELTDGCVCCTLQDGLASAFATIRSRPTPPDHLILELSGIADPRRVIPWANSAGFRLDSIAVLIDTERLLGLLLDDLTRPLVETQIAAADILIKTKLDLVEDATALAVDQKLAGLVPGTPVMDLATDSELGALLDLAARYPGGAVDGPLPELFDPHVVTSLPLQRPITRQQINTMLDRLGEQVIRAKGIAEEPGRGRLLIQVVGRRRSITELPDSEDETPTDLVVVSIER